MKVLFWVDSFPTFSETFIRDQIVSLLDQKEDVLIYPNNGIVNHKEFEALKGFESYNLLDSVVDIDGYYKKNKLNRILKFISIIFFVSFSKNFKYYRETLLFKKHGAISTSLRLFFRIHFVLKNNIDIIHAHFGTNGNDAAILKEVGLPIKLFTTFHGYDIRLGLKKGGHIYKNLFKQADGIFAISDYNYKNLLNFGAIKTKLISLSNGINVPFFKRNSPISQTGVIKLLTVARLVEEKSLDLAIKALYNMMKEKPDLTFEYIIVGEGEKRNELEELIISLDLLKQVKLVGAKNSTQVRDFMVQSDVFLLSSEAEALPTVMLEAQAAEMVVLATNVGSVKDIVKSGLVVEPNNVEFFKNGLLQLLDKRKQWELIAMHGKKHVSKYFDIRKHTKDLMKFYAD